MLKNEPSFWKHCISADSNFNLWKYFCTKNSISKWLLWIRVKLFFKWAFFEPVLQYFIGQSYRLDITPTKCLNVTVLNVCNFQVMPLENNMKTPQSFLGCPGVLNFGMSAVVILYSGFGFFGYLKYGEITEGSITLNLPKEEWLVRFIFS